LFSIAALWNQVGDIGLFIMSPLKALGFLDELLLAVVFEVNRLPGWLSLGFPFGIGL
jgi:hypothetical protein